MATDQQKTPYRVLARKYRPRNFDELIGQDALVRTWKNAIETGRIAHGYMLTGVRGVGKTTTARIIARALNYTGADGKAGPTTGPTDDCEICRAIAEDRHPDILEMDAASRTGVDDIREITDGVRYAPTSARYKVYIIDEVHMLSKQAFNALLKTLEEPPPRVIFIFATTEIRKVPVTVLSRCQRFDLKRVDAPTLAAYYKTICAKENVQADEAALNLIGRAADGSVRDGLSLLDQAIALSSGSTITADSVRSMLGFADRGRIFDLLNMVLKGQSTEFLSTLSELHRSGADPSVILSDLLDAVHVLTRFKAVPDMKDDAGLAPDSLKQARDLAAKTAMPVLGRAWQILLKGAAEVQNAPNAQSALEMVLIRLAYAADLPDPADLLRRIKKGEEAGAGSITIQTGASAPRGETINRLAVSNGGGAQPAVQVESVVQAAPLASLEDVEAALRANGHMILAGQVYQYARLVKFEQGRIELRPEPDAPPAMVHALTKALYDMTGTRWMITVSAAPGASTLAQVRQKIQDDMIAQAKENPIVQKVLEIFPGTKISIVKE